jgi:hypothetical protein
MTHPNSLPQVINYQAAPKKFHCGKSYDGLTVVNFTGPDGSKASAFCCNMNLDADGEPQAYAPFSRPDLKNRDVLGNAGWKGKADNDAIKTKWEKKVKELEGLENKQADLIGKAKSGSGASGNVGGPAKVGGGDPGNAPQPANPTTGSELKKLEADIKKVKDELKTNYYWHENPADRPANYGSIFWHWYGVRSLPKKDEIEKIYHERVGNKQILRHPVLDKAAIYEDVYGHFPVVQSQFEPGPGFFVSQMPHIKNTRYPDWDQRYFLPEGAILQGAYGALSSGFQQSTGVRLYDTLFALRLDTGHSLGFPYRDTAHGYKVGECSIDAFASIGGVLAQNINKSRNDFLLVYLAFPAGQTPQSALTKFGSAANADDLLMVLSFLAQATLDAKGKEPKAVSGDPIHAFDRWKKSGLTVRPAVYDVIETSLRTAGFTPLAQRYLKRHPDAMGGQGAYLKL